MCCVAKSSRIDQPEFCLGLFLSFLPMIRHFHNFVLGSSVKNLIWEKNRKGKKKKKKLDCITLKVHLTFLPLFRVIGS